jgi:signal transduction histidine kinase
MADQDLETQKISPEELKTQAFTDISQAFTDNNHEEAQRLMDAYVESQKSEAAQQAREQALEEGRLEGAQLLAGTIRHTLNDELAMILGYAELIKPSPQDQDLVNTIITSATEAGKFVNRLGEIKRIKGTSVAEGHHMLDLEASIKQEDQPE